MKTQPIVAKYKTEANGGKIIRETQCLVYGLRCVEYCVFILFSAYCVGGIILCIQLARNIDQSTFVDDDATDVSLKKSL